MNIVEAIKSELGGEVLGKLSSVIGESEDKTKTALSAAIPGLLSMLAHLVSSSNGADRVINALRQVDTGPPGGLGDVLSSGQSGPILEKGGNLLNILLGSNAIPVILGLLSKFAGIASGSGKNLLSMLAPLILSVIAKQLTGKPLDASTLSGFFAEQAPNIKAALPPGFSLANIPGFSTASSPAAPAVATDSGLPGWLLPLVGLAVLAGLAWYFFGSQAADVQVPQVEVVKGEPRPDGRDRFGTGGPPRTAKNDAETSKIPVPVPTDPAKLGTDLGAIYTSLTELLGGVKDVPTAEAAVPKLKDLDPKIDVLRSVWDKLPDAAKATVAKVTTDHLAKLKELVTKVLAIAGVSDKLKPVVDSLLDKLAAFAIH